MCAAPSTSETTSNGVTPLSEAIAGVEANILIAGMEVAAGGWLVCRTYQKQSLLPELACIEWHWSFALYALFALLGVMIAGFVLEFIAGLFECVITCCWKGYGKFVRRPNKRKTVLVQKWVWKVEGANKEFSRRRLRILVTRNTAVFFLILSMLWLWVAYGRWCLFGLFLSLSIAFFYLWLDAQKGWNLAVERVSGFGEP